MGTILKNTRLPNVYLGIRDNNTFRDTTYYDLIPKKDDPEDPKVYHTFTVNASRGANIRLTTMKGKEEVNAKSTASIQVEENDLAFYKITKEGYNTIYSWEKVPDDLTIEKSLTPLCFKFTTMTPKNGSAPEEAYALKFRLRNKQTYALDGTGYVNWEDVKNITTIYDYGTYEELTITSQVSYSDGLEVDTSLWLNESSENVIPYYSEPECINQIGIFSEFPDDWIYWEPRVENDAYLVGWLKEGYEESIKYRLPFMHCDKNFEKSGATMTVDWGDGQTSQITGALTEDKITHGYESYGIYQISITSSNNKMPHVSFNDYDMPEQKENLLSIDAPFLEFIDANTNPNYIFQGCLNLNYVCDQAFANITRATSAYFAFYNCKNLFELPKGILNMEGCYGYSDCFKYTSNLKHGLFIHPEVLKNVTERCSFDRCFEKQEYISLQKGKIQPLWLIPYKQTPSTNNTFRGDNVDSASNWLDVPSSWGGPTETTVTITSSTDPSAIIKINGSSSPQTMLSGQKYTYSLTPSNPSMYSPYKSVDYAVYPAYPISKYMSKTYSFGKFPTDGSHIPMTLWKIDDKIFACSPSGSSASYEGSTNVPVYQYNADRDRWYVPFGIPEDLTLMEGNYAASTGVFKLGNKYFTVLKNTKVYSSLDGYTWEEEINTTGISEYDDDWIFPDEVASNNEDIALIRLYNGTILYTDDGINYEVIAGIPSGYKYTFKYINNYFWFSTGNKLYRSTNGKNFSAIATFTNNLYTLSYANGKYFGQPYSTKEIWYSDDGVNWNVSTLDTNTFGVRYYNGKYLAYTYGGLRISTDGINWTTGATGVYLQEFANGIQFDDGLLIMGSYSNITQCNLRVYT